MLKGDLATTPLAPLLPLPDQPTLKLALQASVTLDQVELPAALQSMMARP